MKSQYEILEAAYHALRSYEHGNESRELAGEIADALEPLVRNPPAPGGMRPELEIIRAHDILLAVILGEVGEAPNEETRAALSGAADVLCWVLDHDHNQNFGANLAALEKHIEAQGYRLQGPRVQ